MKYLTFGWWSGECVDENAVKNYWNYFDSIKSSFPESIIKFTENISLHDSNLLELNHKVCEDKLQLLLNIFTNDDIRKKIVVNYNDLLDLKLSSDPEKGLGGPYGFGDLGYDEFDVEKDYFIHRLLFSSGIEIIINFKKFEYLYL